MFSLCSVVVRESVQSSDMNAATMLVAHHQSFQDDWGPRNASPKTDDEKGIFSVQVYVLLMYYPVSFSVSLCIII